MSRILNALRRHPITERQRALTHRVAALLLDYPDERLTALLPMLRTAVGELPEPMRGQLGGVLDHMERTPARSLAEHYVKTFDLRRRSCLHLTYYAYGDTRKRGTALLGFTHAYRLSGFDPDTEELPDHLCVVLEFAATVDPDAGARLLVQHRAGLELLHLALQDDGSPYTGAVSAVSATLPPLTGRLRDAVARLAAEGPPDEEVGLEPFAPTDHTKAHS
ncbi:nitrate reductase molybdenum cofactor assembly chaperone [Nocardiopsis quinghaiensis]|uniref:nitrate reductase molybdenum cofactor assembly chaperone n=1 Tax=Nocardiopsis quinghaiensis TaxID=464995 RepID=UPI0012397104|nr:nitrate reductase molybdenum cofactor assembly chaperone [Nocardiopsis quinghaiensis]